MNQIKAFVGHSFSDRDKAIVSAFLDFFDQLKGIVPHFSWEHARAAEPKELADKVLAIIADKNVFIGICTENEVAANENSFEPLFLRPDSRKIAIGALQSKTSDWIIQEIGLAKGRGMELVLLVEEGLRQPGGLQGNIEYIPFSRDNPQKSFGRIVEMITALSPDQSNISTPAEPPTFGTGENDRSGASGDLLIPKADWKAEDYRRAVFRALLLDNDGALDAINEAFLQSPANTGADAVLLWEGNLEFRKVVFGKSGSLGKLRSLVEAHPQNAELTANLARGLAHYDEHSEAAKMYLLAASLPSAGENANGWRARAAVELAKAGQFDDSKVLIEQLKSTAGKTGETELLASIGEISELRKNDDAQIAVMERVVVKSPDNFDVRFSLAFKHSELGNDDMALYHYLKIPFEGRTSAGWNNLGVAYDRFSLRSRAVSSWRTAGEKGETLAMSNLGQKLLRAGFLEEAEAEFSKAQKIDGYHKNVDTGLADLKDIPDEENKKLEDVLEKVHRKAEFYKTLGTAIVAPEVTIPGGSWLGKDCVLEVSVSGGVFKAAGSYEVKGGGLGIALFGGTAAATKYEIEYECSIVGRVLEGIVKRKQLGETNNSLLSLGGDGKTKVLMTFSSDGTKLDVLENPHSAHPSFYALTWI